MTTSTQPTTKSNVGRPWLWIVAAFTIMIAFWAVIVTIAVKNLPETVQVVSAAADGHD